jgi:hypothetical protein
MPYAIVLDALPTRTPNNCVFMVHMGSKIFDFLDVEDARMWIHRGVRGKGFCTYLPHGDSFNRWKGILQDSPTLRYRIEIKVPRTFKQEKIAVHVFERHGRRSLSHVVIGPEFFLDNGFDLNAENIRNVGHVLSPILSTYLFALICKVHRESTSAPIRTTNDALEVV